MDLSGGESWLSDEKFDFNLNLSKSSAGDQSAVNDDDDDDEEVFFGALTHKERVMATIAKERDELNYIATEKLKPEEQALLLRESALVSLRIKQGNPSHFNQSPAIAIVHPMKRGEVAEDNYPMRQQKFTGDNIVNSTPITTTGNISNYIIKSTPIIEGNIKKSTQIITTDENTPVIKGNIAKKSTQNITADGNKENISNYSIGKCTPIIKGNSVKKSTQIVTADENKENISNYSIGKSTPVITKDAVNMMKENNIVKSMVTTEQNKENISDDNKIFTSAKKVSRLSLPAQYPKYQSEFKEPVLPDKKMEEKTEDKKPFRKSCLPTALKTGIPKTKSGGGIPSLLPSKLPSCPKQAFRNSSTTALKKSSQSVSGIAQPQLRLLGRKCASQGIPNTIPQVTSAQRQQSVGTPCVTKKSPNEVEVSGKNEVNASDLITPIVKSGRSIVGRQLISDSAEASRIPSPDDRSKQSDSNVENDVLECNTNTPDNTEIKHVMPVEALDPDCKDEIVSEQNINNEIFPLEGNAKSNLEDDGEDNPQENKLVINIPESSNTVGINEEIDTQLASSSPLLIDVLDCFDTDVSPVKTCDNILDPFETGNTPPPLIQLDNVLQPERPNELNLIEF